MKFIKAVLVVCIVLSGLVSAQIAVIVHKSNVLDSLSLDELRQIYHGNKSLYENGSAIVLVETQFIAEEFYQNLYTKSRVKMKKYWIGLVFSGRSVTPPTEKLNTKDVLDFVAKTPGAIAFIPAANVDDRVKILRIDMLQVNEPAYPLQ